MKPRADSVTRSRELVTTAVPSGHCAKKDATLKAPMSADPANEPLADDFLMEVPRQLWKFHQVADWMQVSERTVQRWVAEGRLQAVRLSEGCVRFDPRKVVALADEPAVDLVPPPAPSGPTRAPRLRPVRARRPKAPAAPAARSFREQVKAARATG